jgi:hypothetical protein
MNLKVNMKHAFSNKIKLINIIGGSNSVIVNSYAYQLKKYNFNVNNFSLGGTNSMFGLINIINHVPLEKGSILILEYFINDCRYLLDGVNSVERTEKILREIIQLCNKNSVKLLLVLVPDPKRTSIGVNFPMYIMYKKIIDEYKISAIDLQQMFSHDLGDNWRSMFDDFEHLNKKGMEFLLNQIIKTIDTISIPQASKDYIGKVKLIKIKDYLPTKHLQPDFGKKKYLQFKVLDLHFYEIPSKSTLEITFNNSVELLGVTYVCDINSGYIEVTNGTQVFQKKLLKLYPYVIKQKKFKEALITFNQNPLVGTSFTIKNILKSEIKNSLIDTEPFEAENFSEELFKMKIVSLLIYGKADVMNVK